MSGVQSLAPFFSQNCESLVKRQIKERCGGSAPKKGRKSPLRHSCLYSAIRRYRYLLLSLGFCNIGAIMTIYDVFFQARPLWLFSSIGSLLITLYLLHKVKKTSDLYKASIFYFLFLWSYLLYSTPYFDIFYSGQSMLFFEETGNPIDAISRTTKPPLLFHYGDLLSLAFDQKLAKVIFISSMIAGLAISLLPLFKLAKQVESHKLAKKACILLVLLPLSLFKLTPVWLVIPFGLYGIYFFLKGRPFLTGLFFAIATVIHFAALFLLSYLFFFIIFKFKERLPDAMKALLLYALFFASLALLGINILEIAVSAADANHRFYALLGADLLMERLLSVPEFLLVLGSFSIFFIHHTFSQFDKKDELFLPFLLSLIAYVLSGVGWESFYYLSGIVPIITISLARYMDRNTFVLQLFSYFYFFILFSRWF